MHPPNVAKAAAAHPFLDLGNYSKAKTSTLGKCVQKIGQTVFFPCTQYIFVSPYSWYAAHTELTPHLRRKWAHPLLAPIHFLSHIYKNATN
mmetsp:Transcript_8020/g.7016  ORF Transcript_8020/g.7016 Transcript_8020/m.7016 type:complete len:91 (+) Transcript_8020:399-671(+)